VRSILATFALLALTAAGCGDDQESTPERDGKDDSFRIVRVNAFDSDTTCAEWKRDQLSRRSEWIRQRTADSLYARELRRGVYLVNRECRRVAPSSSLGAATANSGVDRYFKRISACRAHHSAGDCLDRLT
jgi:hypothetical protein